MKKGIISWQFWGFVTVSLLGTLSHFLYEWTDSVIAALFSGINESTWEHMKLLFFPMFLFAIIESFFIGKKYENFWCVKIKGTLLGIILIPVIFYTLRGILGSTPDWINIGIFFVSAAIAFIYETMKFGKGSVPCKHSAWAVIAFCLINVAFWIFTFMPPHIPLFQDPVDMTYGLQ